MSNKSKLIRQVGIALVMSFSSCSLFAGGIATEEISGNLYLTPTVSYDSASLRVSSDNTDTTMTFAVGEAISFDTSALADGVYAYELALATNASTETPNGGNVASQNGGFKVQNGAAIVHDNTAQEAEAEAERLADLALQANSVESEGVPQ